MNNLSKHIYVKNNLSFKKLLSKIYNKYASNNNELLHQQPYLTFISPMSQLTYNV